MNKPATPRVGKSKLNEKKVVQAPSRQVLKAVVSPAAARGNEAAECTDTRSAILASNIGREVIGPLCYGFAKWLVAKAREAGITQLYFLSRDGWLLKQAFDALPPEATAGLTSHYLYSSRRAVWFASLDETTGEAEFNEILAGASPYVPVADFLTRIFLEPRDFLDEIRAAGFADENVIVETTTDKQKLYELFQAIKPHIVANAAKEREDYLAYLKHNGVLDNKKAALVDVGWTGSIIKYTRALAKRVDESIELNGFFLGVGRNAQDKYGFTKGDCLHGYLFDFDDEGYRDILSCFFVIEKFLSPNEPSLIRMRKTADGFAPVYKEGAKDAAPLNKLVQKSALQFVRDYGQSDAAAQEFDVESFLPRLRTLLTAPDRETAAVLSQYSYSSDFGYHPRIRTIAKSSSSSTYLRKPLSLFKGYRNALWKPGFIAQQPLLARIVLRGIKVARLDKAFDEVQLWKRRLQ